MNPTHPTPDANTAAESRDWLRARLRAARAGAICPVALGLLGTLAGIGQAASAGLALAAAIAGQGLPTAASPLAAFAAFALFRAGLGVLAEGAGFDAGAAARRSLRSDALSRILAAGPALLRRRHSADLAGVVVDQVEALDGLFARWLPAAASWPLPRPCWWRWRCCGPIRWPP